MSEDTVQRLMGLARKAEEARVAWVLSSGVHSAGYERQHRDARSAFDSALREALMPAGWRPEPTQAMLDAFQQGFQQQLGVRHKARFKQPEDLTARERMSAEEAGLRAMLSASAFPVELEQPEQPLGDAADAAGLSAPALRASASIPIAKDAGND
jgi:hypothetical protein